MASSGPRHLPEPALPLARWRARGEVAELSMADLQFSAEDANALAMARHAAGLTAALSPDYLAQALQRTQGWAAGLQLVLGHRQPGRRGHAPCGRHTINGSAFGASPAFDDHIGR